MIMTEESTSTTPSLFSPLAKSLLDGFAEGVLVFSGEGKVIYANDPAREAMRDADLSEDSGFSLCGLATWIWVRRCSFPA